MDTLSKLSVIKTLQQTDIRLYELLEMSEYPAAIQLLLECRKALQVGIAVLDLATRANGKRMRFQARELTPFLH